MVLKSNTQMGISCAMHIRASPASLWGLWGERLERLCNCLSFAPVRMLVWCRSVGCGEADKIHGFGMGACASPQTKTQHSTELLGRNPGSIPEGASK